MSTRRASPTKFLRFLVGHGRRSDPGERRVRCRGNLHRDGVTGADAASFDDDGHHTGTPFGQSVFPAAHDLAEQTGTEFFDLTARVA